MNTSPQARLPPKDETKEGTADFKNKLAKFINPFYVSFIIFWVVCNYDFLLILIGKKAILHELYAHFGYGCKSGKNYVACTGKKIWIVNFPLYFIFWKVAIPLGLTWLHAHFVYNTFIKPVNNKHRTNIIDEEWVTTKALERVERERRSEHEWAERQRRRSEYEWEMERRGQVQREGQEQMAREEEMERQGQMTLWNFKRQTLKTLDK